MDKPTAVRVPRFKIEADSMPELAMRIADSLTRNAMEDFIEMLRLAYYTPKQ